MEATSHSGHSFGRVGPNAIIQLAAALSEALGSAPRSQLFETEGLGGYLRNPPQSMVDETEAARLFDAVCVELSPALSQEVLTRAGQRTAAYVAANRIPKPLRRALRAAPAFIAAPILLWAIRKNAWTFAGSGSVATGLSPVYWIEIADNPLATPGCPWHTAVFETLFKDMASPMATVRHTACRRLSNGPCRFEIKIEAR
ncbi:MAG: bacteriochlorophyll 4-vinyl reductase [Neomegalonema sp.]